jgi:hypothetical protein
MVRSRICGGCLAGVAAIVALLLVPSSAGSIGKSEKPRPDDQPMALGEPPPPTEPVERAAQGAERAAPKGRAEVAQRVVDPDEVVAAEQRKHLERMAQINRIQVVGIESEKQVLVDLARELRDKETRRHELSTRRIARAFGIEVEP